MELAFVVVCEIVITFAEYLEKRMMLKKYCNILFATAISLMVMLFNVGATVMYCSHSHTVKVAVVEDCCMSSSHNMDAGCALSSGCMQYQHLKLSPSDNAKILTPTLSPLSIVALPIDRTVCQISASLRDFVGECAWMLASAQHPPRAYLSKIRVLLI